MSISESTPFVHQSQVDATEAVTLLDYLGVNTVISRRRIKDGIAKGAVWVKRGKGQFRRIYRSSYLLKSSDQVAFYYDEHVLNRQKGRAWCVVDLTQYSVWFKPVGFSSDGDEYSDHNAMSSYMTRYFRPSREMHVVHKLDKDIGGITIFAHSNSAASKLSLLFARHKVQEHYRVQVQGNMLTYQAKGVIDTEIEGKTAQTVFECIAFDEESNTTIVLARRTSQRPQQLQMHFKALGFPVVSHSGPGDDDLEYQILLIRLIFDCPILKKEVDFQLDEKHYVF